MKVVRSLVLVFLITASSFEAFCQATLPEGPESPASSAQEPMRFVGLEVGAQYVLSSGTFTAPCACEYGSGNGMIAPVAGAFVEYTVAPGVRIAASGRYAAFNADYTSSAILQVFTPGGDPLELPVERTGSVRISSVSIGVDARWYPGVARLFVSAGPDIGLFMRGTFKDEEKILTPGYVYPDTKKSTRLFAEGDIKDAFEMASLRVGLRLAAGVDIPLAPAWFVVPEVGYLLALTPVTSVHSSWKMSALQGLLRVKFGF